jgi:putative FmdB family regulatory protein
MPIYEYECPQCEQKLEKLHGRKEILRLTCAHCSEDVVLQRCISNTYFKLKGQGWYRDRYDSTAPINNKESDTSKKGESAVKAVKKEKVT